MATWSYLTISFAEPIACSKSPTEKAHDFHLNLGDFLFENDGLALIDRFSLPLVSHPSALADWSREITEPEYLDLIGPPDLGSLLAKHRNLKWMVNWRSEPGKEKDYAQIEAIFDLISEFDRGNRAVRYRLTVSDLG